MQPGCEVCESPLQDGVAAWHKRCPDCGLEVAAFEPRVNQFQGVRLEEGQREVALRPIREQNFERLLNWIIRVRTNAGLRKGRPSLLDVGCAHGWFLDKASRAFDVIGIEPDEEVAARAAARGLPIRTGYFPGALLSTEKFDVIVFNDVLEHIPNVVDALRQCMERLNPGGVVVVNAPDRRGVLYRLATGLARMGWDSAFERMWQKDFPSPHLYYFSSSSLSRAACKVGLGVVGTTRLPSIVVKGLYSRIRYASSISTTSAALLAIGILPLVPLLRLLPADISVWALAKKG